jgi:hypothetical protein
MGDHTLDTINAISGAFAAIGTVAAVIVALVLARRDEQLRPCGGVTALGRREGAGGAWMRRAKPRTPGSPLVARSLNSS